MSPSEILSEYHLSRPIANRCIDDIDIPEIVRFDIVGQAFRIFFTYWAFLCAATAAAIVSTLYRIRLAPSESPILRP